MSKFLKVTIVGLGILKLRRHLTFHFYVAHGTLTLRSRLDGHAYMQLQKRKLPVYINTILLFSVPLS